MEDLQIVALHVADFHGLGGAVDLDVEAVLKEQHHARGTGVLTPGKVGRRGGAG